jgi:hypothetical protein
MPNISRWRFLYMTNGVFYLYQVSFVRDMQCVANVYIVVSSCSVFDCLFCLVLVFLGQGIYLKTEVRESPELC